MQTMDLRVRVVSDERAVREYLLSIPAAFLRGPFQKTSWLEAWLAVREPARRRLAIATVVRESTGACLFVLPLSLETRSGVPCWTPFDDGVCDYNAPLLAPDFDPTPQTMRWIWARILDQLPPADLIFIEKMPERIGARRNPLLDVAGVRPSRFRRHPLPLDGDLEEIRARFHGRRSLARKRRKLGRKGVLDFVVVEGAEAVPLLDRLMSWRERRYDARPITSAFYRRLLQTGDIARLGALRLDGEMIAGCFGILGDGALRLLVIAFDDACGNWSPGLLAIEDMIAWSVAEGLDEFDFTIGSEPYKFDFAVETEPLWEIRRSLRLRGSLMLRLLEARRTAGLVLRALPGRAPLAARRILG